MVAQGADDVRALTGNQGTLHQDVPDRFAAAQASGMDDLITDQHASVDAGHDRHECRCGWPITHAAAIAYLNPTEAWAGLHSVAMVERERHVGVQVSRKCWYYLSSLSGDAYSWPTAVHARWGIANRLHWVLDIAFREDDRRVRVGHAAHNLAILRRFALNLLRQETTARLGIKAKRLQAAWSEPYLLRVLGA